MDISAFPSKCIDISKLPIKESKARRIFILADGKRSVAEIIKLTAIPYEEGVHLVETLLESHYLCFADQQDIENKETGEGIIDTTLFINQISEEFAKFVGPFASVVMGTFNFPTGSINKNERQRVINTVIKEIEGEDDKRSFLHSLQQAGLA